MVWQNCSLMYNQAVPEKVTRRAGKNFGATTGKAAQMYLKPQFPD